MTAAAQRRRCRAVVRCDLSGSGPSLGDDAVSVAYQVLSGLPAGSLVQLEVGDARYVEARLAWLLIDLLEDATAVTIVGTDYHLVGELADVLDELPTRTAELW